MDSLIPAVAAQAAVRIDIIRHGEPEGGKRYRGDKIDDPLSARGWAQMHARVDRCVAAGTDNWTALVSSPLARCRAFAEKLATERGLPLMIDPNLRERGFGVWEGLTFAQVQQRFPEQYRNYKADPALGMPEGGEAMDQFYPRISQAIEQYAHSQAAMGGGALLIIGHAVMMRTTAVWALQAPLSAIRLVDTEYASLLSLRWRGNQAQLVGLSNE
ncbi:MAG: histidine phosphatase family protein [Halothiobacillus sp.]